MELGIDTVNQGDVCVMTLDGEVDIYSAPDLKMRLAEAIEGGCAHVAIDLSRVGFMDSSGLGALMSGLTRIKERSGSIRLVAPNEQILRVFQITGLDKVFPIFESVEDAY